MNGIYLLLGSNMGNRMDHLREAKKLLIQKNIRIIDKSSIYETQPWGIENQDWFLNVALQVEALKTPNELLKSVFSIEEMLGRIRKEKWGERCIDIDILYYHDMIEQSKYLSIPHSSITERRFALTPLAEMCPLEVHPVSQDTQIQLLTNCTDRLDCELTDYRL